MHQIVQRLGLRPRPYWGSSQRSQNPIVGKGKGKRREGEGSDGRLPPLRFKSSYKAYAL